MAYRIVISPENHFRWISVLFAFVFIIQTPKYKLFRVRFTGYLTRIKLKQTALICHRIIKTLAKDGTSPLFYWLNGWLVSNMHVYNITSLLLMLKSTAVSAILRWLPRFYTVINSCILYIPMFILISLISVYFKYVSPTHDMINVSIL